MKRLTLLLAACGIVAATALAPLALDSSDATAQSTADQSRTDQSRTAPKPPENAAVQRTRKTVRMLDDIYKQTVVLITDKYVHDEDDFPAGSAAVALFANISKAGWHEVRLIDATGKPYDDKNVARDAFEKEGLKQLKAGKDYYEQIAQKDGKNVLRAITPVPVVMKKCVMCHEHYADAKKGEAIGAISYSVPIE